MANLLGAVILLEDITALTEVDKLKTEFILSCIAQVP
jgi:hypothetical protein